MAKNAVTKYLASIGRKGGSVTSEAKAAAAQANGKRGGRPPKTPKAERLVAIRKRIAAGLDITPAQAALHYADKHGDRVLPWARRMRHATVTDHQWWDAVIANLERGVR